MPNIGQELASLDFASMIGGPLVAVVNAQAQASLSAIGVIKNVGFEPDTKDQDGNLVPGSPVYVSFKYPKEIAPYQPASAIVQSVNVVSGGTGYTSAPTVTFTGGGPNAQGATAVATISNGAVTGVTITNPGSGYTADPTVAFSGGGGTGAVANATHLASAAVPAVVEEMQLEVPILMLMEPGMVRIDEATVNFHAKLNSVEYATTDSSFGIQGDLTIEQKWRSGSAKLNVSAAYQSKTSQGTTVDRTYSMDVQVKVSQAETPPGVDRILGILENSMRERPILPAS